MRIIYCKPEDHQRLCAEHKTVVRDCGGRHGFFTEDGIEISMVRIGQSQQPESGTVYVDTQQEMEDLLTHSIRL